MSEKERQFREMQRRDSIEPIDPTPFLKNLDRNYDQDWQFTCSPFGLNEKEMEIRHMLRYWMSKHQSLATQLRKSIDRELEIEKELAAANERAERAEAKGRELEQDIEEWRQAQDMAFATAEASDKHIAQLRAGAGAMREALELAAKKWCCKQADEDLIEQALASDAGRAYAEEIKRLREENKDLIKQGTEAMNGLFLLCHSLNQSCSIDDPACKNCGKSPGVPTIIKCTACQVDRWLKAGEEMHNDPEVQAWANADTPEKAAELLFPVTEALDGPKEGEDHDI